MSPVYPSTFVDRHRIVVAVSINHTGPYNFLLDTGTQITMIDPSLAAALHLDTWGAAVVAGVGSGQFASYAQLDLVEVGFHAVCRPKKSWFMTSRISIPPIPTCGAFLGKIFLEQFDLLIDNAHRRPLSRRLGGDARRGERAAYSPLVATAEADEVGAITRFAAHYRPSIRWAAARSPASRLRCERTHPFQCIRIHVAAAPPHNVAVWGSGVDGTQLILTALPPQVVKIGSLELSGVSFFSTTTEKDSFVKGFDGVLTTGLFPARLHRPRRSLLPCLSRDRAEDHGHKEPASLKTRMIRGINRG